MLQPYKPYYQARSIRGGREGRLDALSVAENIFFIMKLAPPFWGPFKIEKKKGNEQ